MILYSQQISKRFSKQWQTYLGLSISKYQYILIFVAVSNEDENVRVYIPHRSPADVLAACSVQGSGKAVSSQTSVVLDLRLYSGMDGMKGIKLQYNVLLISFS